MNEPTDSVTKLWKHGPLECMLIGNPECPILKRWTLKLPWSKIRLHHFYPNTSDRDTHDHPWWFITLVVAGSYDDVKLDGTTDHMKLGSMRFRSANHAHKTFAGSNGAWTIVFSQREQRPWGFFPYGKWIPWQEYMMRYGHGMLCEEDHEKT